MNFGAVMPTFVLFILPTVNMSLYVAPKEGIYKRRKSDLWRTKGAFFIKLHKGLANVTRIMFGICMKILWSHSCWPCWDGNRELEAYFPKRRMKSVSWPHIHGICQMNAMLSLQLLTVYHFLLASQSALKKSLITARIWHPKLLFFRLAFFNPISHFPDLIHANQHSIFGAFFPAAFLFLFIKGPGKDSA